MKSLILILLTFGISIPVMSQPDIWKEVPVLRARGLPYAFVDFSDTLHGLLASTDGYFTLTSDGGRSWINPVLLPSVSSMMKIKMTDASTALCAATRLSGQLTVFKVSNRGGTIDSLQIPSAFVNQYVGSRSVSILNPNMIGCLDAQKRLFYSTTNFGASWDTLVLSTGRDIQATDSLTLFCSGGIGGIWGAGYLMRSDDGGITWTDLYSKYDLDFTTIRIYTNELACFSLGHTIAEYPGWSTLLLYNFKTNKKTEVGNRGGSFFGEGALFSSGSSTCISSYSYLVPLGNATYTLAGKYASDPMNYRSLAFAGPRSVWYLTMEGRLFTYADNIPDPVPNDSVAAFYPLAIGDRWMYQEVGGPFAAQIIDVSVIGDTAFSGGRKYFTIARRIGSVTSYYYERIDPQTLNLYRADASGQERLLDSLRAVPGDTVKSSRLSTPKVFCDSTGSNTVLGTRTVVKYFSGRVIPSVPHYRLAQRFGLIYQDYSEEDSNLPLMYTRRTTLAYAQIDGKEYGTPLSVNRPSERFPQSATLGQNYPNPFNPATTISFSLPSRSFVTLKIFDMLGRDVATVVSEPLQAGNYSRQWNAQGFPSGVYFYRLQAGSFAETKRLVLLR